MRGATKSFSSTDHEAALRAHFEVFISTLHKYPTDENVGNLSNAVRSLKQLLCYLRYSRSSFRLSRYHADPSTMKELSKQCSSEGCSLQYKSSLVTVRLMARMPRRRTLYKNAESLLYLEGHKIYHQQLTDTDEEPLRWRSNHGGGSWKNCVMYVKDPP